MVRVSKNVYENSARMARSSRDTRVFEELSHCPGTEGETPISKREYYKRTHTF